MVEISVKTAAASMGSVTQEPTGSKTSSSVNMNLFCLEQKENIYNSVAKHMTCSWRGQKISASLHDVFS